MSVKTSLTLDDINQVLTDFELGECLHVETLENGTSHTKCLINTSNLCYVLTLFEEDNVVELLIKIHDALNNASFPSTKIVPSLKQHLSRIQNKPALLFSTIEGSRANPVNNDHCQLMGHYLATLHNLDCGFLKEEANSKGITWAIKKAGELLEDKITDEDAQIIEDELRFLSAYRQLSLPTGFIHSDCLRDKVLFKEHNESLALSVILDFEKAHKGVLMYDLAIVINDWCSLADGSLDRMKMREIIAAYSKVRVLESLENQSIPMMLRAAAFHNWISKLCDGDKKSSDKFKLILLHRRSRLSGMQGH